MDKDCSSPCFIRVELMSVRSSERQTICKSCDKTMDRLESGPAVTADLCLIFTFQ